MLSETPENFYFFLASASPLDSSATSNFRGRIRNSLSSILLTGDAVVFVAEFRVFCVKYEDHSAAKFKKNVIFRWKLRFQLIL